MKFLIGYYGCVYLKISGRNAGLVPATEELARHLSLQIFAKYVIQYLTTVCGLIIENYNLIINIYYKLYVLWIFGFDVATCVGRPWKN